MALASAEILDTLRLTLRSPRQAARVVMGWPLALGERWAILAVMAVASTLSATVFVTLAPESADPAMTMILANPVVFAAIQFGGLAVMSGLIFAVGRQFGGIGSFAEVLAIVGWIQVILFTLQLAQVVALILLPPLAVLIGLASLALTLWLLPCFIAELHGFRSAFLTFIGMVAAMFALVVLLSLILIFGFGVGS